MLANFSAMQLHLSRLVLELLSLLFSPHKREPRAKGLSATIARNQDIPWIEAINFMDILPSSSRSNLKEVNMLIMLGVWRIRLRTPHKL